MVMSEKEVKDFFSIILIPNIFIEKNLFFEEYLYFFQTKKTKKCAS